MDTPKLRLIGIPSEIESELGPFYEYMYAPNTHYGSIDTVEQIVRKRLEARGLINYHNSDQVEATLATLRHHAIPKELDLRMRELRASMAGLMPHDPQHAWQAAKAAYDRLFFDGRFPHRRMEDFGKDPEYQELKEASAIV